MWNTRWCWPQYRLPNAKSECEPCWTPWAWQTAQATAPANCRAGSASAWPLPGPDSQTGAEIIALMRRLQRERGASFVFSSHDPMVLAQADDVVRIRDGRIDAIEHRDTCAEVAA